MENDQIEPINLAEKIEDSGAPADFFEKCVGYGTTALLFILPFMLHARLYDGSFVVKRAVIEIIVPLLLCCLALKLFLSKKAVALKITWMSLGVIAFLIWNWLSISWSLHRFEAYLSVVRWTASILPFFLLATCKRKEHWIQLWLGALVAAAIGVSLLGIYQTRFSGLDKPWPRECLWPLGHMLLPFERWIGGADEYLWSWSKFYWLVNKVLWCIYKFLGQAASPSSTFINRNFAMHFVCLTLPLSFVWMLRAVRPASIAMGLVALTLNCSYIFRADSRAASLAFWVMLVFISVILALNHFYFRSQRLKIGFKRIFAFAIAVIVTLLITNVLANTLKLKSTSEKFETLFSFDASKKEERELPVSAIDKAKTVGIYMDFTKDAIDADEDVPLALALQRKSMEEPRISMMANTVGMILDHPWRGVGAGNFRAFYPNYQGFWIRNQHLALGSRPEHTHNDYLQIASELGLIGFGVFFALLCLGLWIILSLTFLKIGIKERLLVLTLGESAFKVNRRDYLLILGLGTGLLGLMVLMFLSFPMDRAVPPLLLFLFLGILNSYYQRANPQAAEKIIALPVFSYGLIALCLLAASVWMVDENIRVLKYSSLQQNLLEYEKLTRWKQLIPDGVDAGRALPHATRHLFYLGRAYAETGELLKATETMAKSLESDPYSAVSQTNCGVIMGRRGLFEEAAYELGRGVRLTPDFALGRVNYGFSLFKIGKIEEGLAQFRKAIALDTSDRYAYMHLGRTLKKLGRLDESLEVYLEAAKNCPKDPVVYHEAAKELLARKRVKEAIEYYRKSLELFPLNPKACFELAKVYEMLDMPDYSKQLYEHMLKNINPHDKMVIQALRDVNNKIIQAAETKAE
ncbi:MAG: O-antigen ligase family protein [Planctomycetes bacterium]|nr:O-antigen ligase family protein [Planctomycetota bacterium]